MCLDEILHFDVCKLALEQTLSLELPMADFLKSRGALFKSHDKNNVATLPFKVPLTLKCLWLHQAGYRHPILHLTGGIFYTMIF